jgi:mannitol/fructose-specific phosphotransferase system IIA component (Ntr-type)
MILTSLQKQEFTEILDELGENLDITEAQFNAAVTSYNAVGNWLCNDNSLLNKYSPSVKPQGSFLIGTAIQPYTEGQDIDIDLVCELTGKNQNWTQKDLKDIVKKQLEDHKKYESILDKEGRRCWTLKYRENSVNNDQYHMDILPAIIANGYSVALTKMFSESRSINFESLAIRITDKELLNYQSETDPDYWLKSNPFGYAKWFIDRAETSNIKLFSLNEAIKPVPKYQKEKLPLQRVVQILKRHRDMMFKDDKERPISIIITTLAAYSYQGQKNVLEALIDVIDRMHLFIEHRQDQDTGEPFRFVGNPVNKTENFADRWRDTPAKERKFNDWLKKVKFDISNATEQNGQHNIIRTLSESFGDNAVKKTFSNIGNRKQLLTGQGNNRFDAAVGLSTAGASSIKPHNFYGSEE